MLGSEDGEDGGGRRGTELGYDICWVGSGGWVIVGGIIGGGGRDGVAGDIKSVGERVGALVLGTGRRTSRARDREQFWTMELGCRGGCTACITDDAGGAGGVCGGGVGWGGMGA